MESRIPMMSSVRKPPAKPMATRLPVPSTVSKLPSTSMLRPPMPSTGIKRPLETASSALTNKRMAPMSLLKAPSTTGLPRFSANPMASREIAAALNDMPDSAFQTPAPQKENQQCFTSAYKSFVHNSPLPVKAYTPIKKVEKEDKEMNTDIEWASFDKEAEINHYKTQIATLQKSLTESEARQKEINNDAQQLKAQLSSLQADMDQVSLIQQEANQIQQKEIQAKEEAFEEEKNKLMTEIFNLQSKAVDESRIKSEIESLLHTFRTDLSNVQAELEKANAEGQLKDNELQAANEKVELYKAREGEFLSTQQENIQLKEEVSRLEEKEALAGIFSTELKELKVVEEENHLLKLKIESLEESCEKTKLLEEQIAQKESEIAYLQSQLTTAQSENQSLAYTQVQLTDWQTKLGSDSPDEFAAQLETLKQSNLILTTENEYQKNTIELHKEQIELLNTQFKQVDDELRDAQVKVNEQEEALHESEEKRKLLEKHNEMLTERADETAIQKMQLAEQLAAQIDQLNSDAQVFKDALNDKSAQLTTVQAEKASCEALLEQRNALINDLNQQVYAAQAKLQEEIAARAEDLDNVTLVAESRVVSLANNPHSEAAETREKHYQELLKENERLKGLVEVLESEEKVADMTVQINNVLDKNQRIAQLEVEKEKCRKVLDKERKNNHAIIRALRSHVTDLTGYTVYMDKSLTTVTLRHTLHEGFKIAFNFTEKGIEFATPPSADVCPRLAEFIEKYLDKGAGYPVFLAAITMDIHQRRL